MGRGCAGGMASVTLLRLGRSNTIRPMDEMTKAKLIALLKKAQIISRSNAPPTVKTRWAGLAKAIKADLADIDKADGNSAGKA